VGDASKPSAAPAPAPVAPQAASPAEPASQPAAAAPVVPAAAAPVAPVTPVAQAAPAAAAEAGGRPAAAAASSSSTVRVNTEKLDSLVDVVGELVIVQSQLMESAKGLDAAGSSLARNLAQFGRITKELQHTAMSLRMVPIKPTFQRMERLVRDLSRDFGKQVLFETRGDETEIDRTVAEEIVDPLVHMVRNSLDHGLEGPADRKAAGKNEQGRLRLAAYHEGSNLVIELIDDGRGINKARVLEKARSQGLVPEGATPPADVILNMIFLPGFSTAAKVTAVSGRGVGMDVVRRNIERLRGQIQIETVEGQGTTFRIRLPLTTAIIDGLLVRVGEDRFILPTITVQVALKPTQEMLTTIQGRGEVIDHRGKILPLHRLHRRFEIGGAEEDPTKGIVVMIEVGSKVYALLVDELLNKQEVVIKNLGALLQDRPGVAGGAILGDGTIALILDPASLCAA
jgi:two-component system chemotaxis sensor kinase CheA